MFIILHGISGWRSCWWAKVCYLPSLHAWEGWLEVELNPLCLDISSIRKFWRSANKPLLGSQNKWRKWCAGEVKSPERGDRVRARSQSGALGWSQPQCTPSFILPEGSGKKVFHNPLSQSWVSCKSWGQSHLFNELKLRTPQKLLKSHGLSFLKGVKSCIQTKHGRLLPHVILSAAQDLLPCSQCCLLYLRDSSALSAASFKHNDLKICLSPWKS